MIEIDADISGEVARVLVDNAQPVEYGEPLFALRPTGKKKLVAQATACRVFGSV